MATVTIRIARRKVWLTLVSSGTTSEALNSEIQPAKAGQQIIFFGFAKNSPLVTNTKTLISMINRDAQVGELHELGTSRLGMSHLFLEQGPPPRTLIQNYPATRVVLPYKISAFMPALWGVGGTWKRSFKTEWKLLLEGHEGNAVFANYPMAAALNQTFQIELDDDSAEKISDLLHKILKMARAIDAVNDALQS